MSMIFHFTELRLSKCNGSRKDSVKLNVNLKFQPSTFLFLCCKSGLTKSCLPSEGLSPYKVSWSHGDW
jgi:hypothetical protein